MYFKDWVKKVNRNYHFMGIGSGWGATDMGTADGPKQLFESHHPTQHISFQDYFKPERLTLKEHHEGCDSFSFYKKISIPSLIHRQEKVNRINSYLYDLILDTLAQEEFPIIIGGDHSLATATWSAVQQFYGQDFGLIWIDAHLDAHTFISSPSKAPHGMPVSSLLGYNPSWKQPAAIQPENLIYLGPRSYEEEEFIYLKERNVTIHFTEDCQKQTFASLFLQAKQTFAKRGLKYGISLDIDALDPEEAPGTGAPAPHGLQSQDIITALKGCLNDPNLLAFELVEYNPHRDQNYKTQVLLWRLLESCLEVPTLC